MADDQGCRSLQGGGSLARRRASAKNRKSTPQCVPLHREDERREVQQDGYQIDVRPEANHTT
jgi:hypothetical protein